MIERWLRDAAKLFGGNTGAHGLFYFAYVESPDHALIELNTSRNAARCSLSPMSGRRAAPPHRTAS